jgi:hypothetical protein
VPHHVARLAAAFETSEAEVWADAAAIVAWKGADSELYDWLTARHNSWSDEAFYFVNWVRLWSSGA